MAMITNDWLDAIRGEFSKPYYRDLFDFVKEEYSRVVVYPPADDIFNAFHFTPLSKVKVLILGQDPYHNVRYRRIKKRFRLLCKIFTKSFMPIWDATFPITVI